MHNFSRDFVYAARVLRQAPGFTLITAGVLAIGIGADCAIFTLVDAVLSGRCRSGIRMSSCRFGKSRPDMTGMLYRR
jgi:hypothetical protein